MNQFFSKLSNHYLYSCLKSNAKNELYGNLSHLFYALSQKKATALEKLTIILLINIIFTLTNIYTNYDLAPTYY
ncbi:hypothetical protein PPBDW_I30058 [Photobacterium kishitanii]|nr:hypothetical protein PPBDW_I30058 [Photobacterium kishitanii]